MPANVRGSAVPQGGLGDCHLVTVPQGVVGKDKGGGGVVFPSNCRFGCFFGDLRFIPGLLCALQCAKAPAPQEDSGICLSVKVLI